jgi:hypothetical protein
MTFPEERAGTMTRFTPEELAVARALRDAAALRREPAPGHPEGFYRMHQITALQAGRWLPATDDPVDWHRAARHLARKGWAARRTLAGSPWYGLTETGAAHLRAEEAARGRTAEVILAQAVAQAEHDLEAARREVRVREQALARARSQAEMARHLFRLAADCS